MNNIADVTLLGEGGGYFGWSVSSAGDVNIDGFSDVIVGVHNFTTTGKAYIFYGGANMNNVPDVIMYGETAHKFFGYSASSAGDLNGDGTLMS